MTLRRRLAVWYGVLIAVVLAAAFTFTYVLHTQQHDDEVDVLLGELADGTAAEARATVALGAALADIRVRNYPAEGGTGYAVWLDREDGSPLVPLAGPVAERSFAEAALTTLRSGFRTSWTAEGRVRALAVPVQGVGHVLAAADLFQMDAENARLRGTLAVLFLAGVLGGQASAWGIAGRVLRPVAELTATAESVTRSHHPSRRVHTSAVDQDELDRLGRAFNAMLSSLEASYLAQQRFVSDVSHELRTPLTTIRGNAELLVTSEAGVHGEVREAAEQIARESSRLTRLVSDLLALARADAGPQPLSARPVELDEVVMEVFDEFRQLPGAAVRVSRLDPATIIGERDRLKEVLITLLDNARRYTPADGVIDIALGADDSGAQLTVTDTGMGISAADAARAFERFWRSEAARRRDPSGSGLGLAIARWIVERHGGTIAFVAAPPPGTRVEVRLPLPAAAAGAARTASVGGDDPGSEPASPSS